MITGSLARRYAKAIFEIGSAQGDLDKLGADLRVAREGDAATRPSWSRCSPTRRSAAPIAAR